GRRSRSGLPAPAQAGRGARRRHGPGAARDGAGPLRAPGTRGGGRPADAANPLRPCGPRRDRDPASCLPRAARERRHFPGRAALRGWGDAAVSTVPWRALAAATSPLQSGALRPTEENVWRHEAIVEALRQVGPALPVRFGTVLADADAVAHALAERYDVLVADL